MDVRERIKGTDVDRTDVRKTLERKEDTPRTRYSIYTFEVLHRLDRLDIFDADILLPSQMMYLSDLCRKIWKCDDIEAAMTKSLIIICYDMKIDSVADVLYGILDSTTDRVTCLKHKICLVVMMNVIKLIEKSLYMSSEEFLKEKTIKIEHLLTTDPDLGYDFKYLLQKIKVS